MKQVIVMRKDLNMRKGKMCAQAAHASMATLLHDMKKHPFRWIGMIIFYMFKKRWPNTNNFGKWLNGPFTKIVVGVDDEKELLNINSDARLMNIKTSIITDIGKTEFNNISTRTCLALNPGENEDIDKVTDHLKLL